MVSGACLCVSGDVIVGSRLLVLVCYCTLRLGDLIRRLLF